jgi:signal transduction histidine kinase
VTGRRTRHVFLTWARPLAPALAAIAYGVYYVVRPDAAIRHEVMLLLLSVALALAYIWLARLRGDLTALRVALPLDTLAIAAMTLAIGDPELVAIAYFWSVGLAAFLLGPRDTIVNAALAALCATVVPYLAPGSVNELAHVTDIIVIALLGGLLAVMSRQMADATQALERERAHDAAALRITGRIRASHDIDEVMRATVEEIGSALEATRCRIRLGPLGVPSVPLHEWRRADLDALEFTPPPPQIQHILNSGEPAVVQSRAEADPEMRAFLERYDAESFLGEPVFWRERVVGVIGLFSDRRRTWRAARELTGRVLPQVGGALAQAEAYQYQVRLGRLRDELVANVSHELRTPLTATIGFLMTLERDDIDLPPERRRELLGIARTEAQRLARLVDDLLELTRFERGGVALVRTRVEIEPLAARAAAELALPVRFEFPEPVEVVADGDRLLQVMENLLANAVRHGAGPIVIRGRSDGADAVVLEVSDAGNGIPHDRVDRVFEPFARWGGHADSTGLGLPISRRIVEAHGGSLVYRPRQDGLPHAFVLTLPRR